MVDTSGIHAVIRRARRRLRIQSVFETVVLASIVSSALVALGVYLSRIDAASPALRTLIFVAAAATIVVAIAIGLARRFPTPLVATRIDRASNLADRLSSACAFEEKLRGTQSKEASDEVETEAFMTAAIGDAVRVLPKADVVKATPFRAPRESRTALGFAVIAALLAGLYFPEENATAAGRKVIATDAQKNNIKKKPRVSIEEDDIDYTRELLSDLRKTAETTEDPHLQKFVDDVEKLLTKAENGELSKEELLDKLAKAEENYLAGSDQNIKETDKDLKQTGKDLQKNKLTKELGKALEKGDLEKAQKAMEELAQKLENNKLTDKQKEQLGKKLEQVAEQFEKREQKKDKKLDQDIEERKKQVEKLQRRRDKEKDPEKRERMTRRLDEKKRELKKLERKREQRKQGQQRRALKELHRNMKKAGQQMRKRAEGEQQKQQQQKLAARSLRSAGKNTGKVDRERRKVTNQKKVASQLTDLKEALRRAKRKGGGQRDLFGKNKRNKDFRKRARGGRGQKSAWRRGQGKGKGQGKGQGQGQGQGQNGQGKGKGGNSYGDEHDPNLMGDPTAKKGTTDDDLQGTQGRGPSTRETILTSAQKGFSTKAYRKVHARYKTIVEEVIRAEKVPSGYKYYVKKYFQKIKPQNQ